MSDNTLNNMKHELSNRSPDNEIDIELSYDLDLLQTLHVVSHISIGFIELRLVPDVVSYSSERSQMPLRHGLSLTLFLDLSVNLSRLA